MTAETAEPIAALRVQPPPSRGSIPVDELLDRLITPRLRGSGVAPTHSSGVHAGY